jgi:Domain of unknown function (DUF4382)
MRSSRCNLLSVLSCCATFCAIAVAGCGNSCFFGFSNNGNGGVIIVAGNPPPSCSSSQPMGIMNAAVVKTPMCETCPAASQVAHAFVTLRSVQIHTSPTIGADSAEWLDLAPHFAKQPRQIDLIGNSLPEVLFENAIIPAGSYNEVRLQFVSESTSNGELLPADNPCGDSQWNCAVTANGHTEPLRFPDDVPELVIPLQSGESDSLLVLPDSKTDLQLSLEPRQMFFSPSAGSLQLRNVLVGRVSAVRHWSLEARNSVPD